MSLIHLVQDGDPFARIPRETALDVALSAEGLAVITYLFGHAPGWEPRDSDICGRFGWGRDRMRRVWRNLEVAGYARRRHRVRIDGGRLVTITDVSPRPIYAGGASTGSGLPASGEPDDGAAAGGAGTTNVGMTHERQNDEKKNNERQNQPAAEGGGKKTRVREAHEGLICVLWFGFEWARAWTRYISEGRAVGILYRHDIVDPQQAQRILAEWAGLGDRNQFSAFDGDAAFALGWACRSSREGKLKHTAAGDSHMPAWT